MAIRFPKASRVILNLSRQGYLPHAIADHWLAKRIGEDLGVPFDYSQWLRTVMYRECVTLLHQLNLKELDALEISPGSVNVWSLLDFKSYSTAAFPEYDVCRDRLERRFDVIIADQVFEHLPWPYRAGKNVREMLHDGGHFLMTTPFLVRVHKSPLDCSRWTEEGLKYLLAECGFPIEQVKTGSWGNRACVKANFKPWARQTWYRSMRNEPNFPVSVWALAKK